MSSFRKFNETFLSIVSFRSHKVTVFCTDTFRRFQCCLKQSFLLLLRVSYPGKILYVLGHFRLKCFHYVLSFILFWWFFVLFFLRFPIAIFQFPIFQTASFFPSSTVVNICRTFRPGPGAALEGGNKAMFLVSFDCSIVVPASTKLREIAAVFLFLRCGRKMFSVLRSPCCQ